MSGANGQMTDRMVGQAGKQMVAQTAKCALTGEEFLIRPEDLAFYEKISLTLKGKKVLIPPPKLCPRERARRRLAYRNERKLYKIKSALSGDPMISFFAPDTPFKVYTRDEWWSDQWDPTDYGVEVPGARGMDSRLGSRMTYDFGRSFFEQFHELQLKVPRPPLVNNKAENSDYCNFADGNKNCYLVTSANYNQDSYYGFCLVKNEDTVDCLWCTDSELLYECVDCLGCYDLNYCQDCESCAESAFLLKCKGVQSSLMCVNLMNKKYYVLNKPVTREHYEQMRREMAGSAVKYQEMMMRFEQLKAEYSIRRANNFISCENVVGENIFNSKDVYHGFDVYKSRDSAYLADGLNAQDCYDICFFDGCELCYESTSVIGYGYRFTNACRDSQDLFYGDNCHSCKNCFGCVGLRNKEYHVLNKGYAREEYEDLVARMIAQMAERGEWGEFFPVKYSLFAYNETLAHDYYPLKKEQAEKVGWRWRE